MRKITLAAFGLAGLAVLGGCAVVDQARLFAAEGAGRAVVGECALSTGERGKNLAAVNAWLGAAGYPHRASALDCDGDGAPDFEGADDG